MNILWSNPAKNDYWNNIDYLLEEWSEKEAKNFISEVNRVLKLISNNPKMFLKVGYRELRRVPITPHITLFYEISDHKSVTLIRFWNNFQNPLGKPE